MSALADAVWTDPATASREEVFEARVAENERRVFRIAYSVLGNPADAEEVAQETFLRTFRRWSTLRDPESFRAWAGRIAFRLALNRRRSRARQLQRDTAWQAARPAWAGEGERVEHLRREVERLPEKLRAVVLLSAIEGMTSEEVAAVLGIPAATVRSRLYLARKRLLEVFKR